MKASVVVLGCRAFLSSSVAADYQREKVYLSTCPAMRKSLRRKLHASSTRPKANEQARMPDLETASKARYCWLAERGCRPNGLHRPHSRRDGHGQGTHRACPSR